jgi:hypothetical protein
VKVESRKWEVESKKGRWHHCRAPFVLLPATSYRLRAN